MTDISIEVVSREPDLTPFRGLWEELYRTSSRQPSTSFEWSDALTRSHLGSGESFVLLRLARGVESIGLVPLVTRRLTLFGYPVVALTPLEERYNTHSDLLARDMSPATMSAFCQALLRLDLRWDLFRMSRLVQEHPVLSVLEAGSARSGMSPRVRNGLASYFLTLPDTFDAYLEQRSGKFRNYLKRTDKKFAALDAEVVEFTGTADVDRGYEMLLQIERASWKHAHGTAISAVPHQRQFYGDLCRGAAAAGRLHLQILTVAGTPAAYNLGYLWNGCYSYLKTSYDEQFKAAGAPTFLRACLVRTLIARGVAELDFPAEPYEWERQWTDTVRWHKVLTLYAPTVTGRALSVADRFRHRDEDASTVQHVDPRALNPSAEAAQ